ncbi:MAG: hypothetical protein AB4050_16025 [Synechococcus sp.]
MLEKLRHMPRPSNVLISMLVIQAIAISICIAIGLSQADLDRAFGEYAPATDMSFVQLFILSVQSSAILFLRFRTTGRIFKHLIWGFIAFGFVFLALDEKFMWHENMDYFIHDFLGIEETNVTDRIDDLIVGFYAVLSGVIIYYWRHEICRYMQVNCLLIVGFSLLVATIFVDLVSSGDDIIPAIFGPGALTPFVDDSIAVFEESLKLIAEGIFIAALYYYHYYSRLALAKTTMPYL